MSEIEAIAKTVQDGVANRNREAGHKSADRAMCDLVALLARRLGDVGISIETENIVDMYRKGMDDEVWYYA